jgi:hypothetical protein
MASRTANIRNPGALRPQGEGASRPHVANRYNLLTKTWSHGCRTPMTLHRFGCAVEENHQLLTELVAILFLLQHKQQIFLPVALQTWLGLESLNFTRGRIADCSLKWPIRRVRRAA